MKTCRFIDLGLLTIKLKSNDKDMVDIIYRVKSEYLCNKESIHVVYMRIKTFGLV